jgi:hypothetical protein
MNALEAQREVQNLKCIDLEDVGSSQWMKQREAIELLNIQAHHNVSANQDEFVVEAFISFEKIPVLIHELIITESWKLKIAPLIEDELIKNQKQSIKPYLLFYHEATLANLLECLFYHKDAVLGSGDMLIELVDYCQRKINYLLLTHEPEMHKKSIQEIGKMTEKEVFEEQKKDIQFNICFCALTIFRYITDHVSIISPSILNRILHVHDSIISLVYLIEKAPWKKREKGKTFKWINSAWVEVPPDDLLKVTQYEAQVWLAVNNLVVDPECRKKYEYNSFRKDTVMKLKRFMNEVLIDQIHVLVDLHRCVEELHIMNPPTAANNSMLLVIEQVPELRERLMKSDFEAIAKKQAETLFNENESTRREEIMRMAKLFAEMVDLADPGLDKDEKINLN